MAVREQRVDVVLVAAEARDAHSRERERRLQRFGQRVQQARRVIDGPVDHVDPVRQLLLLDVAEQAEGADDHAVLVGYRQSGDLDRNRIAVRTISVDAVIADEA